MKKKIGVWFCVERVNSRREIDRGGLMGKIVIVTVAVVVLFFGSFSVAAGKDGGRAGGRSAPNKSWIDSYTLKPSLSASDKKQMAPVQTFGLSAPPLAVRLLESAQEQTEKEKAEYLKKKEDCLPDMAKCFKKLAEKGDFLASHIDACITITVDASGNPIEYDTNGDPVNGDTSAADKCFGTHVCEYEGEILPDSFKLEMPELSNQQKPKPYLYGDVVCQKQVVTVAGKKAIDYNLNPPLLCNSENWPGSNKPSVAGSFMYDAKINPQLHLCMLPSEKLNTFSGNFLEQFFKIMTYKEYVAKYDEYSNATNQTSWEKVNEGQENYKTCVFIFNYKGENDKNLTYVLGSRDGNSIKYPDDKGFCFLNLGAEKLCIKSIKKMNSTNEWSYIGGGGVISAYSGPDPDQCVVDYVIKK